MPCSSAALMHTSSATDPAGLAMNSTPLYEKEVQEQVLIRLITPMPALVFLQIMSM